MIEERYVELINMYIDGELDPERERELLSRLETDPRARSYYEEMKALNDFIARVAEKDPPVDIVEDTSRLLGLRGGGTERPHRSLVRYGRLGYAFALVAGVALGIAVYASLSHMEPPGKTGLGQLRGTMPPPKGEALSTEKIPVELAGEGIEGIIGISRSRGYVEVEVELRSRDSIDLVIGHGESLELGLFEVREGTGYELQSERSRTRIRHDRIGMFRFVFQGGESRMPPLTISIFKSGELLFERRIDQRRNRGRRSAG